MGLRHLQIGLLADELVRCGVAVRIVDDVEVEVDLAHVGSTPTSATATPGRVVTSVQYNDLGFVARGCMVEAVAAAIDACIERGILREYLQERRQEVIDVMMELMNQEEAERAMLAEGLAEGVAKGLAKATRALEASSGMTREQALAALGITGVEREAVEALLA